MTSRAATARWILRVAAAAAVAAVIAGLLVLDRRAHHMRSEPPAAPPPAVRSPPPASAGPAAVDRGDPLAVATSVAVALYRNDGPPGPGPGSTLVSPHAAAVAATLAIGADQRSTAVAAGADLLEPRAAPVIVQVRVERWWLDGGPPLADPTVHKVLLTMVHRADGWAVDDLALGS